MYCGECGAKLKKGATFCGECGAKVSKKAQVEKEEPKKKVVKKRQPMSKKNKIIIGVVLVLIVALVVSYSVLSNHFGPKGIATEYLEALISKDADRIYNSLNLSGDTTFTTKEKFREVFENSSNEYEDVVNYKFLEVEYGDGELSASVKFQIATNDDEDTITIKLIKSSEKELLIFDSWQVANVSNSLVVKDYQISVPKNSTVSVNDITLEKKYLNSEKTTTELDVYVIPQIFVGDAVIKTTLPYNIEIAEDVSISNYNSSYKTDVSLDNINDEMVTTLQKQVETDLTTLYGNIVAKKNWDAVKDSYSYNNVNLSKLQETYTDLYEDLIENDDITLTNFKVTSVTLSKVSLEDGRLEISAKYKYDYTVSYKNYKDEVEKHDDSASYTTTFTYDYFENAFKLYDIYGAVSYFSRW